MPSFLPKNRHRSQNNSTTDAGRNHHEKPRSYTKVHEASNQAHRLAKTLLWIVLGNTVTMICLVITLYGFAQIGDLNKNHTPWIKRIFNTVAITLTGMLSIGIGSLFDQMGYMIRWPLLSRRGYSLQEVDDLFQLGNLSSMTRLLFRDTTACCCRRFRIRRKRPSTTDATSSATSVGSRGKAAIALFVVTSTLGRLSVSLFGLAFSVNDIPIVQNFPAIEATIWPNASITGPESLLDQVFISAYLANYSNPEGSLDGQEALREMSISPEISDISNLSTWDVTKNLRMKGMSVSVNDDDSVSYTYHTRNFNSSDNNATASDRSINATSKCTRLEEVTRLRPGNTCTLNQTFSDPGGSSSGLLFLEHWLDPESHVKIDTPSQTTFILQETLNAMTAHNISEPEGVIGFQVHSVKMDTCGHRCSTIWVWVTNCHDTGQETYLARCETSVGELVQPDNTMQPPKEVAVTDLRSISLLVATVEYHGYISPGLVIPENVVNVSTNNSFLRTTDNWSYGELAPDEAPSTLVRDFSNYAIFLENPHDGSTTGSLGSPSDIMFAFAPTLAVDPNLIGLKNDSPANEIWLAGLMARQPMALMAFLDNSGMLNRTEIERETTTATVQSNLEIDWPRVWSIIGVLVGLQFLAVAGTVWYCRTVIVRDNSTLVLAQTLKTVSEGLAYEVTSIADRSEILRGFGNDEVRYGTVWSGGLPKVDIRRKEQIEARFPTGEYD